MSTKLIMLGTGNAAVTKCYNTCFALENNDKYFLVDAGGGNGILSQLKKADIPYESIQNFFITHSHTDHILGAIWVIRQVSNSINLGRYKENFNIYAHDEVINALKIFCELTLPKKITQNINSRIMFNEVKDGENKTIDGMKFTFFNIHSTKAKQFGFRTVLPNKKNLVCLGDEPFNEVNIEHLKNCDWLLSEAFCLYSESAIFKPYEKNHSTALDAAKLAQELHIKNLVLYHTEDVNIKNRKKLYTEEAQSVFSGNIYVPRDLEVINLI